MDIHLSEDCLLLRAQHPGSLHHAPGQCGALSPCWIHPHVLDSMCHSGQLSSFSLILLGQLNGSTGQPSAELYWALLNPSAIRASEDCTTPIMLTLSALDARLLKLMWM